MDSKKTSENNIASRIPTNEDVAKVYIAEGLDAEQIAHRLYMEVQEVKSIIVQDKLELKRSNYIREGLEKIQNAQLSQATKLMDMENAFKTLRIIQLEKVLEGYTAYYAVHGHFCKLHPVSGEILFDTNGMPIQLNIPSVTREIAQLKEGVSLSEGLKQVLSRIDEIINSPRKNKRIPAPKEIDVTDYNSLFKKRDDE